jgi:glycosyltransferase involved in cell wall biosynthesis
MFFWQERDRPDEAEQAHLDSLKDGSTDGSMGFRVANIICRFNSASGGPTRTVLGIAAAGQGLWRAELFTTDYTDRANDSLMTQDFAGHVNLLDANAQTGVGGTLRMLGLFRSYEAQLLRGVAPDVIHIHGLWSPLLAAYARTARRNAVPYIVAPHGMLEPWSLEKNRMRKALALGSYQGKILQHAAAIHATSDLEAQHLSELQCIRSPIRVIPNPVDEPPDGAASAECAPGQPRILLFLSRIHEKKGLDLLLRAWSELRPLDWRLQIVGNGAEPYVSRLRRFCSDHALSSVSFHGHADGNERESIFAKASALVLPTYSENFGNVVAEALLRGIPVITTTGTPWSDIREKRLGWYVEPKLEMLVHALRELFATDPAILRHMGERGRGYAATRFTAQAVKDRLLQMYQDAMVARHA